MNKRILITIITIMIYMFFSLRNLSMNSFFLKKQILWYLISFIFFFIALKISKRKVYYLSIVFYVILNLLLLFLLIKGESINGSKAWFQIGYFSFQPSEFMKLDLIILLNYIAFYDFNVFKLFILTLIPSILTFLEPDTGNVIFYFVILFSVLFFYKKKLVLTCLLVSIILITSIIFMYYICPNLLLAIFKNKLFYRMDRILNMHNYQLTRSLISIGSTNFLKGNNIIINIPFIYTDFAFSLLVTINGFLFTLIYLINNFICNVNILNISNSKVGVVKNIAFSLFIMKLIQEVINIFMTIGLSPITGITLPFISYGGSSIIIYFILFGLINSKDYNN